MPEETVGLTELATCECEPCKRKKGLPNSVRHGTIHDYSSEPRGGWVVRRTTAELDALRADPSGRPAPTFGIELETSAPEERIRELADRPYVPYRPYRSGDTAEDDRLNAEYERAMQSLRDWQTRNEQHIVRQQRAFQAQGNMSADEAVSVSAPRGLWHPKHDGSVSGPEFASQPGTLAYWRSIRPHIVGMYKALLHGGLRSHDGDTCGMHVNIGNDAFQDASHLERFITLIAVNPRWATRMAQRTNSSMSSWANFEVIRDADTRRRIGAEVMRHGYSGLTHHGSAVNANNSGRIEFRLPRGTLRVDRFYAKLEWTAAMVEYTRNADNVVQVSPFMKWARASGEYPYLTTYMQERFPARLATEGGAE